jgi:hypothetical protein
VPPAPGLAVLVGVGVTDLVAVGPLVGVPVPVPVGVAFAVGVAVAGLAVAPAAGVGDGAGLVAPPETARLMATTVGEEGFPRGADAMFVARDAVSHGTG